LKFSYELLESASLASMDHKLLSQSSPSWVDP
jgi:hypothetical protein